MTHDLAAALLKDVPRWHTINNLKLSEPMLDERAVLAALTAALDPALAERVGEVTKHLLAAGKHPTMSNTCMADVFAVHDAADLITTLLAQNAALRAERDRYFNSGCRQMQEIADLLAQNAALRAERDALAKAHEKEVYVWSENYAGLERKLSDAEAVAEKLRAERDEYKRLAAAGELAAKECRIWQGQAEAAEAKVEKLRGASIALRDLAIQNTDDREEWDRTIAALDAALTETATTEEGK